MSLAGPLGVFLAGGGALARWQAGALHRLFAREGLAADSWMGFSAGAMNAAMLFSGRAAELPDAWEGVTPLAVLRPSLRTGPLTFFSPDPVRALLTRWLDEERMRASAKGILRVVSADLATREPVVATYSKERWDGPLADHLLGSGAIPWVFPPVTVRLDGQERRLLDGGVPTAAPIPPAAFGLGLKAVLVVSMVLDTDLGRRDWRPERWFDQKGREVVHRHVSAFVAGLKALESPPAVYLLRPSMRLNMTMLDFDRKRGLEALALGAKDAEAFLRDPEAYRK